MIPGRMTKTTLGETVVGGAEAKSLSQNVTHSKKAFLLSPNQEKWVEMSSPDFFFF